MNTFNDCTDRDFLTTYIYDEYKTAHGIRPRWIDFDSMTLVELQEMAQQVSDDCDAQAELEAAQEKAAAVKFEKLVSDTVAMGAGDRATAIRWLRDADEFHKYDADHFRYDHGLPFSYPL